MPDKRAVGRRARPLTLPKGQLLTVRDMAKLTRIAAKTIYNLVSHARNHPSDPSRIPFVMIGGSLRFDPEQIEVWIAERTLGAERSEDSKAPIAG